MHAPMFQSKKVAKALGILVNPQQQPHLKFLGVMKARGNNLKTHAIQSCLPAHTAA